MFDFMKRSREDWLEALSAVPLLLTIPFVYYSTRFYPFSRFFRGKIFHYDNFFLHKLFNRIELANSGRRRARFEVTEYDWNEQYCLIDGVFLRKNTKRDREQYRKDLAKTLDMDEELMYLSTTDKRGVYRFSFPIDIAKSLPKGNDFLGRFLL